MLVIPFLATLALAAATTSHKAPAPKAMAVSEWVRTPTGAELAGLFPPAALKNGIEGHTVMECVVNRSGELSLCVIVAEDPLGHGFGAASLKTAPLFRLRASHAQGKGKAGGRVRIPLAWALG